MPPAVSEQQRVHWSNTARSRTHYWIDRLDPHSTGRFRSWSVQYHIWYALLYFGHHFSKFPTVVLLGGSNPLFVTTTWAVSRSITWFPTYFQQQNGSRYVFHWSYDLELWFGCHNRVAICCVHYHCLGSHYREYTLGRLQLTYRWVHPAPITHPRKFAAAV